MVSKSMKKSLLAAAVCGAALSSAGPAAAASYTLGLDPVFGSTPTALANLSWQAFGTFDVADSYLAHDGLYKVIDNSEATGIEFSFTSMAVSFYETPTPAAMPGPMETYSLLHVKSNGDPVFADLSFRVTDGAVSGISAEFFKRFTPDDQGPVSFVDGGGDYSFRLFLSSAAPNGTTVNTGSLAYFSTSLGCTIGSASNEICGVSANPATQVITAVPEPETYALMLAGLGAVAFMARRRRPA